MWRTGWKAAIACGAVLAALLAGGAVSAPPPRAGGPQAVDIVTLKKGGSLRGAILHRRPDGSFTMAVSRDWLRKANPRRFADELEGDRVTQRAAWTQVKERLDEEQKQPREAPGLALFFRQERERMAELLAQESHAENQFFVIEAPAGEALKIASPTPERQRLALFAWHAKLDGVETRDANTLKKALTAAKIDIAGRVPDLSDRLPAQTQDEAEWAARLAVVEYALGEPLDFQGFGDVLVRTGDGRPFDASAILPKILEQQVQALLGDLLEPGLRPPPRDKPEREWLRTAIATAEKSGRRGLRVTRLNLDTARSRVSVETRFVAPLAPRRAPRHADERWSTVWLHTETADGAQARPDAEATIAQDPQVKAVVDGLNALGAGADDALRQAIRVGAATQAAQQAADGSFFAFRDRYLKRLDGPPLMIPAQQP